MQAIRGGLRENRNAENKREWEDGGHNGEDRSGIAWHIHRGRKSRRNKRTADSCTSQTDLAPIFLMRPARCRRSQARETQRGTFWRNDDDITAIGSGAAQAGYSQQESQVLLLRSSHSEFETIAVQQVREEKRSLKAEALGN
jgi:hypothetical protein